MEVTVIHWAEKQVAGEHADKLREVLLTHPELELELAPIRDFLDSLYWKD